MTRHAVRARGFVPVKSGISYLYRCNIYISKTLPLQAGTGPEVSTRFRLPDFKTIGT